MRQARRGGVSAGPVNFESILSADIHESGMECAGWPWVSIVVLAYNRRELLAVTLSKLREKLRYPSDRLEIIVIDNASQDGTDQMVTSEYPETMLIRSEMNVGISGWNLGFTQGKGDYFLVLDDDCYLSGDSLRIAVTVAVSHQADLVSFVARSTRDPAHVFNDEYNTGLLSFWGCAALISRRAVQILGGFDTGIFLWAHELEFTMRLLDRGLRHLFLPQVEAYHMVAPATRLTPRFYLQNTRSLGYIAAKLLRTRHLGPVLINLATSAFLRSLMDWRLSGSLLTLIQGARDGLRHKSSVRSDISALYRYHFIDFVSPFRFVRGTDMDSFTARRRRFAHSRTDLYPLTSAWLQG
ncbi:MAG: glycosyltransferase [Deltaproteobacteria bacterium]|nr:glycosyltransferase [Deltaproteobacteria bacterium]